jgi:protein O-mannosyl-transferase
MTQKRKNRRASKPGTPFSSQGVAPKNAAKGADRGTEIASSFFAWCKRRWPILAGAALLAALTLFAYSPSQSGGFLLDDDFLLTDNRLVHDSDGLYRLWCTTDAPDYWPLTYSTFWLEWRLWGMNPTGYHLMNELLHIASTLLVWAVLRKLAIPGAFLAALLFALHPVNVESVAWIAQRKNTLSMLFFLLSILAYLKAEDFLSPERDRFFRRGGGRWYLASLGGFVLAVLAKGSVVVLPAVLFLVIWWRRNLVRGDFWRLAPFAALAVVFTLLNVWFQSHGSQEIVRTDGPVERLLGAGAVVWFYLSKAVVPFDLTFIYPRWEIRPESWLWWLPLLAALATTALLWRYRKGWSRRWLFAWGYFCVALVPVMGFTDVGFMKYSLVADHYQHLAILAVVALTAAGWSAWLLRRPGVWRWGGFAAAALLVAAFAGLSWRQNQLYRHEIALYEATLEKNPGCSVAHRNLAGALAERGQFDDAISHLQKAVEFEPDHADAHFHLGKLLTVRGKIEEAANHHRRALEINPANAEAHNELGFLLARLGQAEEAERHFRKGIAIKPDYMESHFNLGLTLFNRGQIDEAVVEYEKALKIKSDDAEVHYHLGNALAGRKEVAEAVAHYRKALEIKPDYAEPHINWGVVLAGRGRLDEALVHFRKAVAIQPANAEAQYNLGTALADSHRTDEAIEYYRNALRLATAQNDNALADTIRAKLERYRSSTLGDGAP